MATLGTEIEALRYGSESTAVRRPEHSSTGNPHWSQYSFVPIITPLVAVKVQVRES